MCVCVCQNVGGGFVHYRPQQQSSANTSFSYDAGDTDAALCGQTASARVLCRQCLGVVAPRSRVQQPGVSETSASQPPSPAGSQASAFDSPRSCPVSGTSSPLPSLEFSESPPSTRNLAQIKGHHTDASDNGSSAAASQPHGQLPVAWLRPPVRPEAVRGTEWWRNPLYTGLESERAKLAEHVKRAMRVELNCAGSGAEMVICKTLGIDIEIVSMCEMKSSARQFLKHMWWPECGSTAHLYQELSATTSGGACEAHGRYCGRTDAVAGVDLAMQGLPCQPFSTMRTTPERPEEHTHYKTVFNGFLSYLKEARPKGWVVEEVSAFAFRRLPDGPTYMESVVRVATEMGYYVEGAHMQANTWVNMDRDRLLPQNLRSLSG